MSDKITVAIDASTLDSWDMCHKKYDLQFRQHLTTAWRNINLDRGSLIHLMLKNYYTLKMINAKKIKWSHERNGEREYLSTYEVLENGFSFDDAARSSILLAYEIETDMTAAEIEDTINVVKGYFRKYADENWRILQVEKPFIVELYDSPTLKILGQGICDLIVEVPQLGRAIADHKKRSQRSEENAFNNQRLMYTTALGINTFITNKLVFIKDPDRYLRQINQYDEDQKLEWLGETVQKVKEIIAYTKLEVFTRNSTSCDKYGGCLFKNYCNLSPSRRALHIGREFFVGEVWDVGKVLENERKSA